jgi:hypothetical protein
VTHLSEHAFTTLPHFPQNQLTLLNQNLQFLNFALQQSRDLVRKAKSSISSSAAASDSAQNASASAIATAIATLEQEIDMNEPQIQRVRQELTETKELFK